MKVSLVIPIYNASAIAARTVSQVIEVLENTNADYEILLCDDASDDHSAKVLKRLAYEYPQVRRFHNEINRGLGFTLKRLFQAAAGEIVIYLDCDLPFGVESLSMILKEMDHADIVVLSRYSGIKNRLLLSRHLTSRMYYWFCKFLFDIPVKDIGSGTVGIRREVIETLKLRADGFEIHAELFAKARRRNFNIREIPAQSSDIGRGSFRILRHGPKTVVNTLRVWREIRT